MKQIKRIPTAAPFASYLSSRGTVNILSAFLDFLQLLEHGRTRKQPSYQALGKQHTSIFPDTFRGDFI